MKPLTIVIIGGGAAGVFAALQARKCNPDARITIMEKSDCLLAKVRMSGGGRCNLTNAEEDLAEFVTSYPRGSNFMRQALSRFSPQDTVHWFKSSGIRLVTESDGRVFPAAESSSVIIECLMQKLTSGNIAVCFSRELVSIRHDVSTGSFTCTFTGGEIDVCDRLLFACGGLRESSCGNVIASLGHNVHAPVPSLFTFVVPDEHLALIPGVTIPDAALSFVKTRFAARGSLLVTHRGLSGPAALKLSAAAARHLAECSYNAEISINWCPSITHQELLDTLKTSRNSDKRTLVNARTPFPLPLRLWQTLVASAGCNEVLRWADLSNQIAQELTGKLHRSIFTVTGMDLNKREFVTCGGAALSQINAATMESAKIKGLYFAGEVTDIDGVTGGFNLQAAWTTGWIAGSAMAGTAETSGSNKTC